MSSISGVRVAGAMAAPTSGAAKRMENLRFELAFGAQDDDSKLNAYHKHAAGATSDAERRQMFDVTVQSLTPAGRARLDAFFRGIDAGRAKRMENLQFELAFGDRTDDGRLRAHAKHARGAVDDAERTAMFTTTYETLTWGGKANVSRFLGGQRPVSVPALDSAIRRQFAGRTVPPYEVTLPTNGQASKGVVLSVHGGGWVMVGAGALRAMDGDALRWNERGYTVVNVDYRAGAPSVADVTDFYDAIREWQPSAKVGATGQSAGGHLAMMVAATRPDLDFVVSQAGPSDLTHVDEGTARSRELQRGVNDIWPTHEARVANSPALNASRMGAKLLVATALADELVHPRQGERMRAARPDLVQKLDLERGNDYGFIHGMVSQRAIDAFYAAELALANRA